MPQVTPDRARAPIPAGTEGGPLNPAEPLYASIPLMIEINRSPTGDYTGPPYCYGLFFDMLGTNRITVNQVGYSRDTTLTPSLDNGLTYIATLANPFPSGLLEPVGSGLGLMTNVGQGVSFPYNGDASNPRTHRRPGNTPPDASSTSGSARRSTRPADAGRGPPHAPRSDRAAGRTTPSDTSGAESRSAGAGLPNRSARGSGPESPRARKLRRGASGPTCSRTSACCSRSGGVAAAILQIAQALCFHAARGRRQSLPQLHGS